MNCHISALLQRHANHGPSLQTRGLTTDWQRCGHAPPKSQKWRVQITTKKHLWLCHGACSWSANSPCWSRRWRTFRGSDKCFAISAAKVRQPCKPCLVPRRNKTNHSTKALRVKIPEKFMSPNDNVELL